MPTVDSVVLEGLGDFSVGELSEINKLFLGKLELLAVDDSSGALVDHLNRL